ncbi:MAG: alpha-L-fucosidase [Agriterribacter sp.]
MKARNYIILVGVLLATVNCYSQNKIRIACIGNSITYRAGIADRETNSYPAQLGNMLGEPYEVRNFGKSGATLLRKGNLPYWDAEEYRQALNFQPNWVFIMLGTNDSKPVNRVFLKEYIQDYKELIKSFRQLPAAPRIVLLLPVPVFSTDTTGITASIVRDSILPMVRQTAYETGCEVINLYNLLIDSPQLFPDNVHPSAEGATIVAGRIRELVIMRSDPQAGGLKQLLPPANLFNFYGFEGYDFTFHSRNAKIVIPKQVAPGQPWVWRARFWGHEPQTDIALLERGFHIAYCDVGELFGNDEAISIWDHFYQMLTGAGLAKKSVMEGMSRGGVYIYRWAAKYPERVAAIYADAPVLDLKSWPGGKGVSPGSQPTWEIFKKDFGYSSEKEALAFKGNPLDLTEEIANGGFPMLHVVGDADHVVPVQENTALFEQQIKTAGGFIKVIHKPGVDHHPHSLPNPQPIVDFILMTTDYRVAQNMIPLPSKPQKRWQQYERLMFVHFAPNTWTGLSQDDNSLPLNRINPTRLDTDQWCRVAKSWGAKMIVFVAKHSGGFCWWQTNTTDYGVKNIPWKKGKGDVLADLSGSCDKYGLDLGVYIYPGDKSWGAGLGSGGRTKDPSKQEAYNKVFRQQLTEVLSKYKPMKEVWFDGSCIIDISDILQKHASDAVIFQGPQANIRWVGNERGIAPYPNWYTTKKSDLKTGTTTALHSDPDGDTYAPVEIDVPFLMTPKTYKWFWAPDTDDLMLSVPDLMGIYNKSVGRGSVLLLNATPDTSGLIPESHTARYKAFGREIRSRFSKPVTPASVSGKSYVLEIDLKKPTTVNCIVIQEDIAQGQRVRKFVFEGFSNGQWRTIKEGSSIGSKRIESFLPVSIIRARLRITEAIATPVIRDFALFNIKQSQQSANNNPKSMAVTLSDWNNYSFTTDWQDFTLDLTPFMIDKVGQFELKFQTITHDRNFEKDSTGGYGLEFKDPRIEWYGASNPDAIQIKGNGIFLINNSQHISAQTTDKIIFGTQIRTRPGRSVGTIELKMIEFE